MAIVKPQSYRIEIPGAYQPEWLSEPKIKMAGPSMYRVNVENIGNRHKRTLFICGKVRNLPSLRGSTNIPARTVFQHGGHLIAARFGGSTRRRNIVPMHGAINQVGGTWYRLEEQIADLLENDTGTMSVDVKYDGPLDLVPASFLVQFATHKGNRITQKVQNGDPFLLPPTHPEYWRTRIINQLKWMNDFAPLDSSIRDRVLSCDSLIQLKKWAERLTWVDTPRKLFDEMTT